MISEKEQYKEWLSRVLADISDLRKTTGMTKAARLGRIRKNYEVLAVLIKVANKDAYMIGAPVISSAKSINN